MAILSYGSAFITCDFFSFFFSSAYSGRVVGSQRSNVSRQTNRPTGWDTWDVAGKLLLRRLRISGSSSSSDDFFLNSLSFWRCSWNVRLLLFYPTVYFFSHFISYSFTFHIDISYPARPAASPTQRSKSLFPKGRKELLYEWNIADSPDCDRGHPSQPVFRILSDCPVRKFNRTTVNSMASLTKPLIGLIGNTRNLNYK